MVAGRPYYPRYAADFIMGVRGFDLETVGAYSLIVDHLNERDRPLPDDDRFMAGLLHCSPQRWRKIRAALVQAGKIVITPDDYITNPRFERDRAKRNGDLETARLWGRAGGLKSAQARQLDMDLDAGWQDDEPPPPPPPPRARTESGKVAKVPPEDSQKSAQNFRNSFATHSPDRKEKPSEIKAQPQAPPQGPCARATRASPESEDSTLPTPLDSDSRVGRLDDADLVEITNAVCEAAGYRPVSPAQINRATAQVEEWRKQGISFDDVILPAIRSVVSKSNEPTRTLGRFRADVAHQHARFAAAKASGKTYQPPAPPLLEPDDEDALFRPIRAALLEACGAQAFALAFNRVRFRDAGECQGDKHPLRLDGPDYLLSSLRSGGWRKTILTAASPHGFTDVW